jgi:hypothetical protein
MLRCDSVIRATSAREERRSDFQAHSRLLRCVDKVQSGDHAAGEQ